MGQVTASQQEITVLIGDKLPDRDTHRAAGRVGFDFAGAVWDSSVGRLVDQQLGDLLVSAPQS